MAKPSSAPGETPHRRTASVVSALLGIAIGVTACGPWPNAPAFATRPLAKPIDGDAKILAEVRNSSQYAYPKAKIAWIAVPEWSLVRNAYGVVTGRRTTNTNIVSVMTRVSGSNEGWPDLCEYREATLSQEALNAAATEFGKAKIAGISNPVRIECSVYESAE